MENRAKVIIGARSALYLPYADLGVIIVDESHDSSYKQEDAVNYQGRDMAVVRGKFERSGTAGNQSSGFEKRQAAQRGLGCFVAGADAG